MTVDKPLVWGVTLDISQQNAHFLLQPMIETAKKSVISQIEADGGRPISEPTTEVTDWMWVDEDNGSSHPMKRIIARCSYIKDPPAVDDIVARLRKQVLDHHCYWNGDRCRDCRNQGHAADEIELLRRQISDLKMIIKFHENGDEVYVVE
jgi:hypothetical protein